MVLVEEQLLLSFKTTTSPLHEHSQWNLIRRSHDLKIECIGYPYSELY